MEGHHLQRIADALSELSEKVMFLTQSGIIVEGAGVEGESGVEAVEKAVEVEGYIKAVVEGKLNIKAVKLEPGNEIARIHLTLPEANSNMREVEHSSFGPIDSLVLAISMPEPTANN